LPPRAAIDEKPLGTPFRAVFCRPGEGGSAAPGGEAAGRKVFPWADKVRSKGTLNPRS
jgi:hypothetical protein